MEIYTIGFTKKSAAAFFESLKRNGIHRLVDVRVHNTSQLAGFTKRDDLEYFLKQLLSSTYVHQPLLAPTRELLKAYRSGDIVWEQYEESFFSLMAERRVEDAVLPDLFVGGVVLLCSEASPEYCHRRLVVEYLDQAWGDVRAVHL